MKFSIATVTLLAVAASAANIKRQDTAEEDEGNKLTIKLPDVSSKIDSLSSKVSSAIADITDVPDAAESKASEIVSDIASKATDVASDLDSLKDKATSKLDEKVDAITSFVGSAVADGITLSIPDLPTASVNTEALNSYISAIQTKFEPDVVSQIKNGQTPAVVSSFIDSLPTEYKTVAVVAFSEAAANPQPQSTGGNTAGSGDEGSDARSQRGLTGMMAAVVIGVAGLAIYL